MSVTIRSNAPSTPSRSYNLVLTFVMSLKFALIHLPDIYSIYPAFIAHRISSTDGVDGAIHEILPKKAVVR